MTNSRENIFQRLLNNIREIEPELSDREISVGDSLRQLGLDSMQRVEIILATMEALEIDVPRSELNEPQNISELVDLFVRKVEERS